MGIAFGVWLLIFVVTSVPIAIFAYAISHWKGPMIGLLICTVLAIILSLVWDCRVYGSATVKYHAENLVIYMPPLFLAYCIGCLTFSLRPKSKPKPRLENGQVVYFQPEKES